MCVCVCVFYTTEAIPRDDDEPLHTPKCGIRTRVHALISSFYYNNTYSPRDG